MKHRSNDLGLRVIAAFKLVKAAALLVLAAGLWSVVHDHSAKDIVAVIEAFRIDPNNEHVHRFLARLVGLRRRNLDAMGLGTILYAALFAVEGLGLWQHKRWAEYLTLIITTSFIPIELYELARHASALKALALIINIAIAIYLARKVVVTEVAAHEH